jgi:hypothetical protein
VRKSFNKYESIQHGGIQLRKDNLWVSTFKEPTGGFDPVKFEFLEKRSDRRKESKDSNKSRRLVSGSYSYQPTLFKLPKEFPITTPQRMPRPAKNSTRKRRKWKQ